MKLNTITKKLLISIFSPVLLVACSAEDKTDPAAIDQIQWVLESAPNSKGELIDQSERIPNIRFDLKENRINGFDGCNRFFGTLSIEEPNKIEFKNMGSTKMACPDMQHSDLFLARIGKTQRFELKGNRLILISSNADEPLIFTEAKQ